MIGFFVQYLIANKIGSTRGGLARRTNNFDNRRFPVKKKLLMHVEEIIDFKIKFVLDLF